MLRRLLFVFSFSGALVVSALLVFATRADAAIITGGCSNTNVSCTMPELTSGAFFAVNGNLFANFDVLTGPSSAAVVVTPLCDHCGSFGGGTLVPGFSIDFGGTFTLATKGTTVTFVLTYDFFPSEATFGSTTALLSPGTVNGAGDNVHIDLFSSGFPGPDLALSCPSTGCPSNTTFGTSRSFFSPTSSSFEVIDEISMLVDADTGGTPFVALNSFTQEFRAIPEPSSIAMLGTGLLLSLGFAIRRRGRSRPH